MSIQNQKEFFSKAIVSGKINLNVNSNLEIDQCDIQSSSIINLYYKSFQSKTKLEILSSKNISALSESFKPGQLNINIEDVNDNGEIVVIEGIDKNICLNELDNITLPASNFRTICDNNNSVVKVDVKKEKDKSSMTLYIIIGVIGAVALALIILLVVLVIKKKDQLKKKEE